MLYLRHVIPSVGRHRICMLRYRERRPARPLRFARENDGGCVGQCGWEQREDCNKQPQVFKQTQPRSQNQCKAASHFLRPLVCGMCIRACHRYGMQMLFALLMACRLPYRAGRTVSAVLDTSREAYAMFPDSDFGPRAGSGDGSDGGSGGGAGGAGDGAGDGAGCTTATTTPPPDSIHTFHPAEVRELVSCSNCTDFQVRVLVRASESSRDRLLPATHVWHT